MIHLSNPSIKTALADVAKCQQSLIGAAQTLRTALAGQADLYSKGQLRQKLWEIESLLGQHPLYFSQAGQDRFLHERFFPQKREGRFLEIGGFNGWMGSNAYFFEKTLGWSGVVVEPSPRLAAEVRFHRSAIVIEAAVAGRSGTGDFIDIADGYTQMGGLSEHYVAERLDSVRQNPSHSEQMIRVPLVTLNDVVAKSGLDVIDFCSIDVEGAEHDILSECDWSTMQINVLVIENGSGTAATSASDLLTPHGYQLVDVIGFDEVFERTG